jgi:hypothetical protein
VEQIWYQLTNIGTPALLQLIDEVLVAYLIYRIC